MRTTLAVIALTVLGVVVAVVLHRRAQERDRVLLQQRLDAADEESREVLQHPTVRVIPAGEKPYAPPPPVRITPLYDSRPAHAQRLRDEDVQTTPTSPVPNFFEQGSSGNTTTGHSPFDVGGSSASSGGSYSSGSDTSSSDSGGCSGSDG